MMTSGPERSVGPIVTSVLSFIGRASFFLASNSRTSSGEGGGVLADCFGFFSIRKSTSASQARNHRKYFTPQARRKLTLSLKGARLSSGIFQKAESKKVNVKSPFCVASRSIVRYNSSMNPFPNILLVGLSFICMEAAEPRIQGRSLVISRTGIVATEQVLASQVGAQILADGGNAADAAVAANAMMGLVSPGMCGIGGDMFCLVYDAKSGRTYGLAANGWSPQKLTPEFLREKGITIMPTNGIHSVTVPGAVEG